MEVELSPPESVESAIGCFRIFFQTLLQQSCNGAFRTAYGAVEQKHASFGSIPLCRSLEDVNHFGKVNVQAIDCISAPVRCIFEEAILDNLPLVLGVLFLSVRKDHVVHSLKSTSSNSWVLLDNLEVLLKVSLPVEFTKVLGILILTNQGENIVV